MTAISARPPLPCRASAANQKRTFDVLPKPDKLISYTQLTREPENLRDR